MFVRSSRIRSCAVAGGVRDLRGQAVIVLGPFDPIAMPALRVAVSILAFAVQHDHIYVAITSTVLARTYCCSFLAEWKAVLKISQ